LFLSEAIFISGLQSPFFTVNIMCVGHVLWIGRPRKCKYSGWNFTNMLFLQKVLLFPVLGAILDFRMSVHDNTMCYTGAKTMNKTRI